MDTFEPQGITREDLHRLVWETPLRTLAASFHISDIALAKVCRKLNVPLPGRGYWNKVAAGHSQPKRPLPPTAKHQVATIKPSVRERAVAHLETKPLPETLARVGNLDVPAVA